MTDDAAEQILDALEAAGAVAGHEAFLTPDEIAAETGLDRATVDGLLTRLRFEDQLVLKGPDEQWRKSDPTAFGVG